MEDGTRIRFQRRARRARVAALTLSLAGLLALSLSASGSAGAQQRPLFEPTNMRGECPWVVWVEFHGCMLDLHGNPTYGTLAQTVPTIPRTTTRASSSRQAIAGGEPDSVEDTSEPQTRFRGAFEEQCNRRAGGTAFGRCVAALAREVGEEPPDEAVTGGAGAGPPRAVPGLPSGVPGGGP